MFRKDPTRSPPLNILSHPLEDVTRLPPLTIPLNPIEDVLLIKELNLSGHRCDHKLLYLRKIWIRHAVIRNPCWQMEDPFTQNQNYYPTYIETRDGSHIYVRKNYTRIALDNGNVSRRSIPRMTEFGMQSYMDISDDSDDNDSDNNEITNTIDEFRELTTDKLNDKDFMRYLELKYGKSSKHITSYEMRLFLDEIRDRKTEQTHEVPKDNVKVKVVFGDDICILRSDRLDENELKTFISQSFDLKGFHLKYEDEDHDMISINTKNDLENAFDCASVKRKCLKVFVFKNAVPKTVFTSSKHNTNGDTDSYESNSDMITAYKHNSGLIFILCVLCVILCLLCVEDRTSWRGKTWQEETKMSDKMEQYDVLEGRAYHLKTKETLHPLKVSRDDKEQQNGNKKTLMEDEQITLPTESVEDDSSASDSGDDNDTSVDATEDFIDNIDSQDDVDCADNDSFEATDQESPDSINATDSQDEDNDNDNESQDEDDNINDNESENNDESQDTNSQESGDGDTSDMNESEEKEMKPAIQFKLKDKMGRYEVRWDGWSYNTWTGSLLLYHPFNPMRWMRWNAKAMKLEVRGLRYKDEIKQSDIKCYGVLSKQYCMMPCQAVNRSLVHQSLIQITTLPSFSDCNPKNEMIESNPMVYDINNNNIKMNEDCGTQTTHQECWLDRAANQERSGIGWIMNGTDWESKNKTIRERLLGNKDEMNQSDIQCYGTLTKQICVKNYVPLQTLKRSLVHQSLIPISPLQSINDDREEEGDHRKHGDIDLNVMVYDTTRIIMCEDREIHKERWRNINQEMNQENIKKEEMMKVTIHCGLSTESKHKMYQTEMRCDSLYSVKGMGWESKMKTIKEILLGNKDEMNQSDIQCYGTLTKQICVKNYVPLQTLKRSLVHQSLIPISPLQSINDDSEKERYHRKHGDIDLNVMVYDTNPIMMNEEGGTHQVINGGLNEGRRRILAAMGGGGTAAIGGGL
eukprot:99921_1